LRARREQAHGVVRHDLLEPARHGRDRERRHRVLVLAGKAQRCAARRKHAHTRRRGQHGTHRLRRCTQLLEVVEDEQDREVADVSEHGFFDVRLALGQFERARDRREHEAGLDDRREIDEGRSVAKLVRERFGDGDRESRLTGPAGTRQRHEPDLVAPEHRFDRGDLEPPSDQRSRGRGQP
jgi:hypothetical protein